MTSPSEFQPVTLVCENSQTDAVAPKDSTAVIAGVSQLPAETISWTNSKESELLTCLKRQT